MCAGDSMEVDPPAVETAGLTYRYGGGAAVGNRALSDPKLEDVTLSFPQGSRVLVAGANGAGKSTLMSIWGGKKMISDRNAAKVLGAQAFHDTTLGQKRMYCGDWWRTNFFHNLSCADLLREKVDTPRVQKLIDLLQVDISWRINAISDGQRRRIQHLEVLADPKEVYILDEITTDLDVFAREELLNFLREETEQGATVVYATHIFDQMADWATHFAFFSKGRLVRACTMSDLKEYHALVAAKTRVPLYALMKEWVFREYPPLPAAETGTPWPARAEPTLQMHAMSYAYGKGAAPSLKEASLAFYRGQRVLLVGANGSCKSTVMAILGGKRLVPRGGADVLGRDCFNDGSHGEVTFCGDWWHAEYFMNLTVGEVLGAVCDSARVQHLVKVLQVDLEWRINSCSDGQRRRCQLLELLATPRPIYLLDEITSDLDLFAREGVLQFIKAEAEIMGATVVYCTHIFDHLENWATHILQMSKGTPKRFGKLDELPDYQALIAAGAHSPLCSLVRSWVYDEYQTGEEKPWRNVKFSDDGRVPNLGLAGGTCAPTSGLMHS
jgi:CCR4-NOT complex subunit CAF16